LVSISWFSVYVNIINENCQTIFYNKLKQQMLTLIFFMVIWDNNTTGKLLNKN